MGMSTTVVGLTSPDEPEYVTMSKLAKQCKDAGVGYPHEVVAWFRVRGADPDYPEEALHVELLLTDWDEEEMSKGLELKVADIPAGVTTLRFYNSW